MDELEEKELKIYSEPLASKYTVHLTDIVEPDFYRDLFYQLENCSENDVFEIVLNTYGGQEDTAIQLYNAIISSPATVVGRVSGYCCSAGTIVLLACRSWVVPPNSKVMIHSSSGGTSGKSHETQAMVEFESLWLRSFFRSVYKGFLTDKEIEAVLGGKDMWFTGEDTVKRLKKLSKEK